MIGALFCGAFVLPSTGRAKTAQALTDFEGLEQPLYQYDATTGAFVKHEPFAHISDQGNGTFRMFLHYSAKRWDEDRDKHSKDRQRSEVKGLGPRQKTGETFEYKSTWRTNPEFKATNRFCHIFQLKATDGDKGAPLVTQTLNAGGKGSVKLWSGDDRGSKTVRTFSWKPGIWTAALIRIKTSNQADGDVRASYDGDALSGKTGVPVYRPRATEYRPKWGLYRSVSADLALGDDYIEHKNIQADKR